MCEEPPELVEIDGGLERVEELGLSISRIQSRRARREEARGWGFKEDGGKWKSNRCPE